MDTIFALATPPGRGGVAVIRVSGAYAHRLAQDITGWRPEPRSMKLCKIVDGDGKPIDEGLVLAFTAPHSFTGEDVVEFQVHGSHAVVQALLRELGKHKSCRLAQPGEFTRRAMENGKLDLSEVEGLADLIDADTEAQRRQAQRLFRGELSRQVQDWRTMLVRVAALMEASIDFADEDLPGDLLDEIQQILNGVQRDFEKELKGVHVAERVRAGFEIAIVGAPNVGKSTLLNALAGRDAAITSDIPGTTRDIIEVQMDVAGFAVTFLDTAGLREAQDEIESIGVVRGIERARQADLRIFLGEPSPELSVEPQDVVLAAKADTCGFPEDGISGTTGYGVENLLSCIGDFLTAQFASTGYIVRARHREAIERASTHLNNCRALLEAGDMQFDLAAEETRCALFALECLVGKVDVEGLLDEIFSSFCLGK